jgi:hypothetical protein
MTFVVPIRDVEVEPHEQIEQAPQRSAVVPTPLQVQPPELGDRFVA